MMNADVYQGWDASVSTSISAAMVVTEPEASPTVPQQEYSSQAEGMFTCQQCDRHYARLCDLNKHSKTHSRPFKCHVETCKYHEYGWPTEKELHRHHNDKHSAAPKTFDCHYQGCSYSSKRESNCKQHMEKAHGWEYVRNRTTSREALPQESLHTQTGSTDFLHPDTSYTKNIVDPPSEQLTLYEKPPEYALPVSQESYLSSPFGGSESYVPWKSPLTRMKRNEFFLQNFAQTYPGPEYVDNRSSDEQWLDVIDPNLSGTVSSDSHPLFGAQAATSMRGSLKALPTIVTTPASFSFKSNPLSPIPELTPATTLSPMIKLEDAPARGGQVTPIKSRSAAENINIQKSVSISRPAKRAVRFTDESEDEDDEHDQPPRKQIKYLPEDEDDFDDKEMPCPFRHAHPLIYDVENDARYLSCYTKHENISTVVRHLGRPAHRLDVNNNRHSISSFGVLGNEHGHSAAGLCKRCWQPFSDSEAFEEHLHNDCEAKSRSKREKYRLISDTFCRIEQSQASAARPRSSSIDAPGDTDHDSEVDSDLCPVARNTGELSSFAEVLPESSRGDEFVPLRDYLEFKRKAKSDILALTLRIAALEQQPNRNSPRTSQDPTALAHVFSASLSVTNNRQPGPFEEYYVVDGPSGHRPSSTARAEDPNERESIVSGMISQSTDYEGDTEQILSAISNPVARPSQSAVHHMSLSPYQRGRQNETLRAQDAGRPKASVADSGYVSNVKVPGGGTTETINAINGSSGTSQSQQPELPSQESSGSSTTRNWTSFLQGHGDNDNFNLDLTVEEVGDYFPSLG